MYGAQGRDSASRPRTLGCCQTTCSADGPERGRLNVCAAFSFFECVITIVASTSRPRHRRPAGPKPGAGDLVQDPAHRGRRREQAEHAGSLGSPTTTRERGNFGVTSPLEPSLDARLVTTRRLTAILPYALVDARLARIVTHWVPGGSSLCCPGTASVGVGARVVVDGVSV